ncbi:hypothetical protein SS50377_20915 [Spironucleus salmonicida]|uniref:Uncharacterized protein n=1 Tax=Spironucleus salmonicida TaxID=348837 RepID=A0A9P8M027_9EUKA|nr:hypothetical protein SS50377_20915 [Spironucleus salmonicida]
MRPSFFYKENGVQIRTLLLQEPRHKKQECLESALQCKPVNLSQIISAVPEFKNKPYRVQILQKIQINNSLSLCSKPQQQNKKVQNLVRDKIRKRFGIKGDIDIEFNTFAE